MTNFQGLRADDNAPWIQRFRAPTVLWTSLAKAEPTRGLAASCASLPTNRKVSSLAAFHPMVAMCTILMTRPVTKSATGYVSPMRAALHK